MNKAVFLDRDGTIISYLPYVTTEDQIVLKNNATEGIKLLNEAGYKVIVVTNQPVIARGLVTEDRERALNDYLIKELKSKGARIDAVYFCPHHPEKHHADIPPHAMKYRIECDCRKPKPGMLLQAAKDHKIDLSKSFMIGDETRDILAGLNAGCKTILVATGKAGKDGSYEAKSNYKCSDLLEAARTVVNSKVTAVILAGGRGERLRPLTDNIPKPMIEIAGKPVLQHQIELLRKQGIREIVLCASYLVDNIKNYFGDGSSFGVHIEYPYEPEQLGSGGAVRNAASFLKGCDRFIIINGDKMIGPEFDFNQMLDYDKEKRGFITILARETDHPLDSDILKIDSSSKVVDFIGRDQDVHKISNSGIVVARSSMLDHIPAGVSNIEKDVTFHLIKSKDVYAFVMPKNWYVKDFGTPERLKSVKDRFERLTS